MGSLGWRRFPTLGAVIRVRRGPWRPVHRPAKGPPGSGAREVGGTGDASGPVGRYRATVTRTEPTRLPEKMSHDRAALDALLASTMLGHIGYTDDDGQPVVLPTAVVQWQGRLVVHGSTGSRWIRRMASGAPVCVSMAAVDGIVVARSAFESSLLYRSAVLFGRFSRLDGESKRAALDAVTERILPGRVAEVRRPTGKELAATQVLAMDIEEWSLRISDGWPEDPAEDVDGPAWAGHLRYGVPSLEASAAPDLRPEIVLPASVANLARPPRPGAESELP